MKITFKKFDDIMKIVTHTKSVKTKALWDKTTYLGDGFDKDLESFFKSIAEKTFVIQEYNVVGNGDITFKIGTNNISSDGENSAIIGGDTNNNEGTNSVIIGGTNNHIGPTHQNTVIIGGDGISSRASNTLYTKNIQTTNGGIKIINDGNSARISLKTTSKVVL